MTGLQESFDVAVAIPTVLRPNLKRAVRSIFGQDLQGRVQILIGIDKPLGDPGILDELRRECPPNMVMTVVDLGYSTAARHGGLYNAHGGGALRTILSFAANSRYLAYLDDDNWFCPYHLRDLLRLIEGHDWAFSPRWFVDPDTLEVLCLDDFISAGPGRGYHKERYNGFVDTNCLLIDKIKCQKVLPFWCKGTYGRPQGADRRIFEGLQKEFSYGESRWPSVFYLLDYKRYPELSNMLRKKGVAIDAEAAAGTAPETVLDAPLPANINPHRGKIFGIGLGKTGTNSLCNALDLLGYRSIHMRPGEFSMAALKGCDAAADTPIAMRFRELDRQFEGSKFVLTLRDLDSWLDSSRRQVVKMESRIDPKYRDWVRNWRKKVYGDSKYDEQKWRATYARHRDEILEYFRGREADLLEIDICGGEGWDKLCPFLGHPRPRLVFPHSNQGAGEQ